MGLRGGPEALKVLARDFPTNKGGLCQKGWTSAELLASPERLTTPLIRRGGELVPASWDEALDVIVSGVRRIQQQYGRDAVAVFGGGGLTNEKCYALGKFARVALGTKNIDYNGRFCMSSAAAAANRAFGVDRGLPFPLSDLADADVILLIGSNAAETMPPFMQWLTRQRENGGELIVIDPRLTATARTAQTHLPVTPGTDLALINGLLHLVIAAGAVDRDYLAARTTGFDEVRQAVESYVPERVAEITGIPVATLGRVAQQIAQADKTILLTARGAEQQSKGVDTVTALINLALALGLPGRPGSGYGCLTGQGNGQGGREHGQKADQLPGYRSISDPVAREHVAGIWGIDAADLPGPGISAFELLDSLGSDDGPMGLFLVGSNPIVSAPDSARIKARMSSLELLVVSDVVLSESAALADVVLPVTQWAEETGTMTNLEGRVLLRNKAVSAPAGVRSDLEVITELARRLDAPGQWSDQPEQVFAELRRASAGGPADYTGISYQRITAELGVFWPCPTNDHPGTPRMFTDTFATPDGRARFIPVEHRPVAEPLDDDFPIYLTTGRVLQQYQSGAQTRRIPALNKAEPEAFVELHPDLAARLTITDGQLVDVQSRRGTARAAARITDSIRRDTVFMPFHYPGAGNANRLTNPALDPISRMPEFKVCAVQLVPVAQTGIRAATPVASPTVCRCNGVTRADICSRFEQGDCTVAAITASTHATTGCGSCHDSVASLVRSLGQNTNRQEPKMTFTQPQKHLVVVGNGMVGQYFVEALQGGDTGGYWQVTVLGEEPRQAYDRVGLSSLFDGHTAEDLDVVTPGCYEHPNYQLHLSETAVGIDRDDRTVTTSQGRTIDYDALVLATGSYPFVPPVPGHDLEGCFVYRTIEDLGAIKSAVEIARERNRGRSAGMVVGGGLLGLEAAHALRLLGISPHVVEMAPRLMPLQVDEGGGHLLKKLIQDLDVTVHVGVSTSSIAADGRRLIANLTNGTELDVDVVVFSAGIRPRDQLARDAGLAVGERGGITVDENCRTSDEYIYAIGECASVQGKVYGLVGPGYSMAQVVADRLLAVQQLAGQQSSTFTGADMSTKLKLMGVDVASFGDALATTEGALEVAVSNPVEGSYAKLVVDNDAQTVLGGVLVGDASRYGALRMLIGQPLPGDPVSLIASTEAISLSAGSMADTAQVCSCVNVTKGTICSAITEHELTDVAAVKACTKAGTGCGSCVPLLKTLLAESGVEVSKALCEHFSFTRAQLFDIVRVTGLRTFTEIVEGHGTGRGCDICKPVVASILASLGNGHILDGEQAALQDSNDHFLANIQKDGTYSVVPRVPGGEITPEGLITIGEIARDFGLYTKITGGQRIDLFGARVEQLPVIWKRLVEAGFESGHAYGKALRTVKSCVGSTWCRYGVQDSVALAIDLELRYRGLRAPHKIKAGVSGCARECAEAQSKDIGVIATENGWNLYVAGNGGARPRHADLLLIDIDTETLVRTIDRFLMFYIRTADRLQRTASWIESLEGGLDYLRAVIVDDSLGVAADLDTAMAAHVESYADEWRGVLEDPERLSRFVSFVNAPDTPDPSISFSLERGQIRPAPLQIGRRELEVVR
jgi:nitrite reductase (NADH) large subunit